MDDTKSIGVSIVLGLVLTQVLSFSFKSLPTVQWLTMSLVSTIFFFIVLILMIPDDKGFDWDRIALFSFLSLLINLPYAFLRTIKNSTILPDELSTTNNWGLDQFFWYLLITSISFFIYSLSIKEEKKKLITVTASIILLVATILGMVFVK